MLVVDRDRLSCSVRTIAMSSKLRKPEIDRFKVYTKFQSGIRTSHLVIARFNHQQRRLVLLHTNEESRQRTSVLLGGVEENRLVHGDPHRQPRPECEELTREGRN